MKFISIGYGNSIAVDRIVALVSQDAKEQSRVIDVSCGRKTRSVIVTDSEHVILSALTTEKIALRLEGEAADDDDE